MIACMKGFSSFGAILILIVGLGMTGVTIYGYFHSQIFLDNTSARDIILSILSGTCGLIIVGSLIGMCGIKKGNGCLICIFQILVIIFLIIFVSIGIATVIFPGKFFEGNCQVSSNKAIQEGYNAYLYSQLNLCRPGVCPCNMNADALAKYSTADQAILNDPAQYAISNPTGATITTKCPGFPQGNQPFAIILGQIQGLLQCSMWCQDLGDNLFYRYSNINNGKPGSYCYTELQQNVKSYGQTVGIAAFVTAGFMLLVCMCNLCICCHPDRRSLKMQDRFAYMNQMEPIQSNEQTYRQDPYKRMH